MFFCCLIICVLHAIAEGGGYICGKKHVPVVDDWDREKELLQAFVGACGPRARHLIYSIYWECEFILRTTNQNHHIKKSYDTMYLPWMKHDDATLIYTLNHDNNPAFCNSAKDNKYYACYRYETVGGVWLRGGDKMFACVFSNVMKPPAKKK